MSDKPLIWLGSSKGNLFKFSPIARRKAGFQLRAVQRGNPPADFKPMSIVGSGVEEIRIRADGAYRVFYIARFEEAVYVLHCFQKKTQRTAPKTLN
ncbi:MAG: type II toxin-antitoxin system RelE/ParE family toxin [Alkalinema sp. RU_4_3]|nr:type II toxin-antitoxin system RelE/ParE family toxin [Alkalinema sp. RU_4_3]